MTPSSKAICRTRPHRASGIGTLDVSSENNTRKDFYMKKEVWTLALGIALLPPIWAVLAPHIGVQTGAVALICAGLYVANGNKAEDGARISVGFLMGDVWAVLALLLMHLSTLGSDLTLFLVLFFMGGLAVIISSFMPRFVNLPSWLCGWAIGLTIMGPLGYGALGSYPVQIGTAMLVGVWYVGWGVDKFQHLLLKR